LALIFRDENAKVIRKACERLKLPERQKVRQVMEEKNALQFYTPNTAQLMAPTELEKRSNTPTSSIPPSLYLNHDIRDLVTSARDPGLNFFLQRYMMGACPASNTTIQPDVFSSPIWRGVSSYGPFLDAVSCVGLAGLSNINHDQEMMRMARMKYAKTLQRVHKSLVLDSADIGYTVKAVMLLTVFEVSHPRDILTSSVWLNLYS
jgi:hypothetical protein